MRQVDRLFENFRNFLKEEFSLEQFGQEIFKSIQMQTKSSILKRKNFYGNDKVFIEPTFNVYSQLFPHSPASESLETFKKFLVQANQNGVLRLTRADLVGAMNPEMVKNSETSFMNATFHFIEVPQSIKEDFQTSVKKNHAKKKKILIGLGKNKDKTWGKVKSFKRSKSAPPGDFDLGSV